MTPEKKMVAILFWSTSPNTILKADISALTPLTANHRFWRYSNWYDPETTEQPRIHNSMAVAANG
jgi:hypothetical protein